MSPGANAARRLAFAAALLTAGGPAAAEEVTLGGWRLTLDESDGLAICAAVAGASDGASIDVYFDETMAKPPHGHPLVTFRERPDAGKRGALVPGGIARFSIPALGEFAAPVDDAYSENNVPYATVGPSQTATALRAMALGQTLEIRVGSRQDPLWSTPLTGFAEVYRRMADHCDFSAEDVLEAGSGP